MISEKKLEKKANSLNIVKGENGHWSRVVRCAKCDQEKTVYSAGKEDLVNLENYECVECRGVLKKFEKEKSEE